MNILSIDPGIKTGWATDTSSGIFDNSTRSHESKGLRVLKFKKYVKDVIDLCNIDLVVYEKPGGRHYNGIRSHANFEGVLISLCEELKIMYKDYSASEIKKHATGKGNCNKQAMVESAKEKWGDRILDDNHADALWLLDLAKKDFLWQSY